MSSPAKFPPKILAPGVAAEQLGLTVPNLVALIRRHRYPFTELALGGRPGDRGRNRWGLTEEQIETIVRGQQRVFAEPKPEEEWGQPRPSPFNPDGKSLLRGGNRRVRPRG